MIRGCVCTHELQLACKRRECLIHRLEYARPAFLGGIVRWRFCRSGTFSREACCFQGTIKCSGWSARSWSKATDHRRPKLQHCWRRQWGCWENRLHVFELLRWSFLESHSVFDMSTTPLWLTSSATKSETSTEDGRPRLQVCYCLVGIFEQFRPCTVDDRLSVAFLAWSSFLPVGACRREMSCTWLSRDPRSSIWLAGKGFAGNKGVDVGAWPCPDVVDAKQQRPSRRHCRKLWIVSSSKRSKEARDNFWPLDSNISQGSLENLWRKKENRMKVRMAGLCWSTARDRQCTSISVIHLTPLILARAGHGWGLCGVNFGAESRYCRTSLLVDGHCTQTRSVGR